MVPGRLPRRVWLLLAARTVNRLGAFSLPFLTVLVSTELGAGLVAAGFVSAAFGLATIPSRLAGGRLADRVGRRRTIVLGLVGCAAAQLGIAVAGSLTTVTISAVLLGLAFELYEPPSQAIIADSVAPADRVRAYSLLNAALALGGMGAGLVAASVGRWGLRWLFVVDALSCLACAVIVRAALPADRPRRSDRAPSRAHASPWRHGTLVLLIASGTVYALVHMQTVMSLPLALAHQGMQPADAGLLLTASAVTAIAAQPLLRLKRLSALSAPTALTLGYLLLAAGLSGYAATHSLPAWLAATVVWSLGDLVILGRALALVADLAPRGGTGRYLAAYGISWGIATVAAPIVGTQVLEYAGPTVLWTGSAATCLALAVAQPLIKRLSAAREQDTQEHERLDTTAP